MLIGWKTFLKSEILFSLKNGQWLPNYTLHLLGGGMEYARLADYYTYHGLKYPNFGLLQHLHLNTFK